MKPDDANKSDDVVRRRRAVSVDGSEYAIPKRFLKDSADEEAVEVRASTIESEIVADKEDVKETLESLSIDDDAEYSPYKEPAERSRQSHRSKKPSKQKKTKKKRKINKKWIIWPIVIILLLALGVAGFFFVKTNLLTEKLFGGSLIDLVQPGATLKTDSQGRTNILLFGTSQDDAAHQNADGGGGLWLTDSIQIVSIDQKNKTVKLVSIPRDLWVGIQNCAVGDYGKINAVYECGSDLINSSAKTGSKYKSQDADGAKNLMSVVEEVTGITPQYYVHVDYTVLKQAVDAVGGIDINIKGDGSSGIYDTNFDWDCPNGSYTCKNVYYPKDGAYHLSGTQALFLSRARGDTGLYSYKDFGLARGDFDRQANQQKVLIALQAKAKTAAVLANPIALNGLLDAFGNNISTDISTGEVKTLLKFAKVFPNKSITQVSLVQEGSEVVTTASVDGQSVVVPTSGTYDFSSIIDYLTKQLSTNPAVLENATIGVYNASETAGAAGKEQSTLQALGLTVTATGNADATDIIGSGTYTLYDLSGGKMPKTLAQLQTSLGVKAVTSTLPSDIPSTNNFVIIINK